MANCGCFQWVVQKSRYGTVQPDTSHSCGTRQSRHTRIQNFEDASTLQRPNQGTWVPSPAVRNWATPGYTSPAEAWRKEVALDSDNKFEIEMAGHEADKGLNYTVDTDMPMKRVRSKYEVEQLLSSPGNLPKPMSPDERETVLRQILPTATFQMMAQVPPELLQQSTAQAQELRRKLSQGATVVFFTAGLPGKRFTFERAAALGIKSVIIDHHDSWSRSLVDEGVIAKFIPVDMSSDSDTLFQETLSAIKSLGKDGVTGKADAIATFVELSVPMVARLTEALGLPGHLPGAVDAARDKHATRASLKAAGLPTPRNFLITSESELDLAAAEVKFPCVLKPVSGAASLGVKKVTCYDELKRCYQEVTTELSGLVVSSGALIKADPSAVGGVDAGAVCDLRVLCEQFLDGVEVDVDVVMSQGEWRYAAVADNGPTLEPYFNETWGLCPSILPKEQQVALKELAVGAVKALGFTAGVFHVECKYTSTGPQLIEVNARMGGGQIFETNRICWGVDLVEETLFAALGVPARPCVSKEPMKCVAYCYVNAMKSGLVEDMRKLEEIQKREGVVWAKPLVQVGAQVTGVADGMPTWLCDLLVTSSKAKDALQLLLSLQDEEPVKVA